MQIDINDVKRIQFPGGERHIVLSEKQIENSPIINDIIARIHSSNDLIDLCLIVDAIKHNCGKPKNLLLPYIPYGRQDRYSGHGTSFSLRVFANIINGLGFEKIATISPHSNITNAVFTNVRCYDPINLFIHYILDYLREGAQVVILSPDIGGINRVNSLIQSIYAYTEKIVESGFLVKKRNPDTGLLTIENIYSPPLSDKIVIIYDDICDGGATFCQTAEYILGSRDIHQNSKPFRLELMVSHGIFSKGFESLKLYDRIYCLDTYDIKDSPRYNYSDLKVIETPIHLFNMW